MIRTSEKFTGGIALSFKLYIMQKRFYRSFLLLFSGAALLAVILTAMTASKNRTNGYKPFFKVPDSSGIILVKNNNGPTLGYFSSSGVKILSVDGLAFKDLNRNGKLDKYEDWRLPVDERSKDLAGKMSIEQIAGLMLYSLHQAIPALPGPMGRSTYNGKPFGESGSNAWDLSDQQKSFLT